MLTRLAQHIISCPQVLPVLQSMRAEEERRAKAAERVQKKLGVLQGVPGIAAAAAAPAGSGGSGAAAGDGSGAAGGGVVVDGGRDSGGRPRRERRKVNYAFDDYDQTLRSGGCIGGVGWGGLGCCCGRRAAVPADGMLPVPASSRRPTSPLDPPPSCPQPSA